MFIFAVTTLLAVALSQPLLHLKRSCPPLGNGTINIESYQLYPENADFDEQSCLLYIGSLYNASVVVYDPYKTSIVSTIEFPNITRTPPFHIGGVAWDPYSRWRDNTSAEEITILVDAAAAHETAGRDVSGDNYIIRYSPTLQKQLWTTNLTAVSRARYGGPQDIEHDAHGNIYVLGTYPGTIQRVPRTGGVAEEWYVPSSGDNNNTAPLDHAVVGYTGFAAVINSNSSTLLVADARNHSVDGGALYAFDMNAPKGMPTLVPIAYPTSTSDLEDPPVIRPADAIYLPRRYAGSVLLITEHDAISVLRSRGEGEEEKAAGAQGQSLKHGQGKKEKKKRDTKWGAAEFLGRIPNPAELAASDGLVTAAVEMGGRVYLIEEWFTDALVPGTSAGNRTSFPLVDITGQLDTLVNEY